MRKSVGVAKAHAWLDGADEVKPIHLECLQDVLWASHEQREQCASIVVKLANPTGAKLDALLREVDDIVVAAVDHETRLAGVRKLEECEQRAEKLVEDGGNGRAQSVVRHIFNQRVRMHAAALGISEDKASRLMED